MAEFGIVGIASADGEGDTPAVGGPSGQAAPTWLGSVDTGVVAAALESLREDLTAHVKSQDTGLRLTTIAIKLTLSAEGKVAFVATGSAEACIEVVFATPDGTP